MPGQLKHAIVRPNLKKESLDFKKYSNYRPICDMKFVSKIIERAVEVQVIYKTRETVFHRDIQTPRRELKIRRAAEYV